MYVSMHIHGKMWGVYVFPEIYVKLERIYQGCMKDA